MLIAMETVLVTANTWEETDKILGLEVSENWVCFTVSLAAATVKRKMNC